MPDQPPTPAEPATPWARARAIAQRLPAALPPGWWPAPLGIDRRERWRVAIGGGLGLGLAALLSRWGLGAGASVGPWLVAPLGASAVLVFALPASPLAQPWPVLGGNVLSAAVGLAVAQAAAATLAWWAGAAAVAPWWWAPLAAGLSVGLAIRLMVAMRCLHPPGGAAALLGPLGLITGWPTAAAPVGLNALLLVLAGIAYNRATGRAYPHRPTAPATSAAAAAPGGIGPDDLLRVLARRNQLVDLGADELAELLREAEAEAWQQRLARLTAADLMSRPALSVGYATPLHEAWQRLRRHGVKALPVVDRTQRVVGIVTRADFLRAAQLDSPDGLDQRLRRLLRPTPTAHTDKPEAVGQIMTRQVRVASSGRSLGELLPLFSQTGHHHLPVIDADRRLVGMLTRSDLMRALAGPGAAGGSGAGPAGSPG